MTQMWSFKLPDGRGISTVLDWAYVPYLEELREWVLENWDVGDHPLGEITDWVEIPRDPAQVENENWRRFYEEADRLAATGTRPKHPMKWVLDKVQEHLDDPD
jgi:hypothetical protein